MSGKTDETIVEHASGARSRMRVVENPRCIEARVVGRIDLNVAAEQHEAIRKLPGWTPDAPRLIIWEYGARMDEISPDVLEGVAAGIAARYRAQGEKAEFRIAHVIQDPHSRALAEVWARIAGPAIGYDIRVFREERPARAWLFGEAG